MSLKITVLFITLASFVFANVYQNRVQKHLQSASELDYPPFAVVTNEEADGFSVELLRSVVKEMGGEVDFYVDEWSKVKDALKVGEIDVLPLVGRTPEREKYFDFSIPYLVTHGSVIIRSDSKTIKKYEDLKDKKLATMNGDNAHEYIQRNKISDNVTLTPNFETALLELSNGKHDAVIIQKLVAVQLIKKLNLTNIKSANFALNDYKQDFSFAVKEGDKKLLAYLNEGLSIVIANGVYEKIYTKWFSNLIDKSEDYTQIIYYLLGILALLITAIISILIWNKSLNKMLNRRTIELKNSEALYKNFFDNSPNANIIYTTDDYGETFRIKQVNRALEKLENIKAKDIQGKLLHEVFKGIEDTKIYKKFQEVYKTGYSIHTPNSLINVNDQSLWRENFIFKLQTGEVVSSYLDHTKEKQLEENILYNHAKTLSSFINLIEYRDSYTGGHSQRVANYSKMVAKAMGYDLADCEKIYMAGILHDIGKIVTPDAILLKPTTLNDSEYELIKTHSTTGANILKDIPMYEDISDIVLSHHERYNGSGYPDGLKGEEIHPMSRIMAICDAFDAMTTNRIYRGHKTIDEAIDEIKSLSNIDFHENEVNYAAEVLSKVILDVSINQLPSSEFEERRFSFFYRDQVTDAYNSEYLNIVLNDNQKIYDYKCLNVLLLHNFSNYNKKHGWSEGNKLLHKIADTLQTKYSDSSIFRLHGDDFAIINKKHIEINTKELENIATIKEFDITFENIHLHIENNNVNNLSDLEEYLTQLNKG